MIQKELKINIWGGLGFPLGGVWDGLGHFGGAPGRLLAILGAFKIYLFSNMGPRSSPKGFLDPSWFDFGKVWGATACQKCNFFGQG